MRLRGVGVVAATAAAVATPLCSCGTTAVVLGMMANMMPWAPIVAFIVSSPLSSPEGLVYSAGLFGWPFATAFFLSSIVLGLLGGWVAAVCENRGWLVHQSRMAGSASPEQQVSPASDRKIAVNQVSPLEEPRLIQIEPASNFRPLTPVAACACGQPVSACPSEPARQTGRRERTILGKSPAILGALARGMVQNGLRLLAMFVGFAFIGYFLNGLIPANWVAALFGSGNIYSVPLAAFLGLPLYINSETSLPLIRALLDNGMSQGAALAFMISGSGTSIGAIAGALTIARWRVIAIVVSVLLVGAILSGYAYNLVLALKWL